MQTILDCCGYKIITGSKLYEYLDCFKSKKGKFFRKNLSDNRKIKKEILLMTICPECKHRVLKYLWYAKNNSRFQDFDESKTIRGKAADEIFEKKADDYVMIDLPNPFKPKPECKHSKKIPFVYYKILDDFSQIPRYIDESADAGLKVTNKIKVSKI